MSTPLAEALERVDLDAGSVYCCRVKGRWVEVRVLETEPAGLAKPLVLSDVRLDPSVELPGIAAARRCPARHVTNLPFDVPAIPGAAGG